MRKIVCLFCFPVLLLSASCKRTLPDYGATSTVKMSNSWWVNYYVNGAAQSPSPVLLSTYNTSNSPDSIWVDDLNNFWQFKGKVKINYSNLTFSATGSQNYYYSSTADIANGKILPKAGHSRAGNVTDSIYIEIKFSDDPNPGTVYMVKGSARTAFVEDDY